MRCVDKYAAAYLIDLTLPLPAQSAEDHSPGGGRPPDFFEGLQEPGRSIRCHEHTSFGLPPGRRDLVDAGRARHRRVAGASALAYADTVKPAEALVPADAVELPAVPRPPR